VRADLRSPPAPAPAAHGDRTGTLEDLERERIREVLAEAATLEEAAAGLGISTTTLWRKRKRYGIE
jgi:NtrC-family two-component system response regulator AlgB